MFHGSAVISTAMYLVRCDLHWLKPWFPKGMCLEADHRQHLAIEFIPLLALVQSMIVFLTVNSCMIYLHFLTVFIAQGIVVEKEIR